MLFADESYPCSTFFGLRSAKDELSHFLRAVSLTSASSRCACTGTSALVYIPQPGKKGSVVMKKLFATLVAAIVLALTPAAALAQQAPPSLDAARAELARLEREQSRLEARQAACDRVRAALRARETPSQEDVTACGAEAQVLVAATQRHRGEVRAAEAAGRTLIHAARVEASGVDADRFLSNAGGTRLLPVLFHHLPQGGEWAGNICFVRSSSPNRRDCTNSDQADERGLVRFLIPQDVVRLEASVIRRGTGHAPTWVQIPLTTQRVTVCREHMEHHN